MAELPWFAERADRLLIADNSGEVPVAIALRHLNKEIEFTGEVPEHPALTRITHLRGTLVMGT